VSSLVAIVLVLYGLLIALCLTIWAAVMLRRTPAEYQSQQTPERSSVWPQDSAPLTIPPDKVPGVDKRTEQTSNAGMEVQRQSSKPSPADNDNLKEKELGQSKENSRQNDAFERFLRAGRDDLDF
jgi:hypothetical protein